MTATIIDGSAIAKAIRAEIAAEVAAMVEGGEAPPHLAVVLCGNDPASATYVRNKGRAAERAGIRFTLHTPGGDSTTSEILDLCARISEDPDVDGMLVQLPLPRQIDSAAVLEAVPAAKDADGFHPLNLGRLAAGAAARVVPGTPLGCMELLRRSGVPIAGSRAVVVGRSVIVGRPVALLLVNADATVTVCHSKTRDLAGVCREADILIAAIGRPGMITGEYVKPGAAVIDVGTSPVDGQLRGDVDRASVEPIAGWLTPVPGGVGPMTIAMLLRNTLALARAHRAAPAR
ncbi:MAG: bifunctional 5,10-methylenetetrahydrofolate dehydrogenase/5,10-methenyltetrahydrofolate cyclohydrolase [Candidatus Dormibacteria bacterium]|nr:bifunctional 5,10-methylene-tetrahydrofolate dehydrogenase/5,10-methylene-tetrahydrofolate cyclohydrolase [Chloroflexota bacterium]HBV93699.1 bifunctional 5,10-methylene-tetrahydrofolate dehydrogenase/5,10-methylene-tetrahydrofolate cyclohydrolase [Chloroflexota bacterium]